MAKSWLGDWHERIYERARAKGYATVTAYADAHPRATMLELASELGPDDVNAAQLTVILRDEAERGGFLERFARSLLVHELWESIPKGWRVDPGDGFAFDFKAATALGSMTASLPDALQPLGERLGRIMMAADLPNGWLPEGPDDPILVGLFDAAARETASS